MFPSEQVIEFGGASWNGSRCVSGPGFDAPLRKGQFARIPNAKDSEAIFYISPSALETEHLDVSVYLFDGSRAFVEAREDQMEWAQVGGRFDLTEFASAGKAETIYAGSFIDHNHDLPDVLDYQLGWGMRLSLNAAENR